MRNESFRRQRQNDPLQYAAELLAYRYSFRSPNLCGTSVYSRWQPLERLAVR